MVANAHAMLDKFWTLKKDIVRSDDADIDVQNGGSLIGMVANAHAKFDKCITDSSTTALPTGAAALANRCRNDVLSDT